VQLYGLEQKAILAGQNESKKRYATIRLASYLVER